MDIEYEVFKRKKPNVNKLIQYGFQEDNDIYYYSQVFMNQNFECHISIDKNGIIIGKVFDLDFHDEYIQHRFQDQNGEFVSQVREEYINILQDIAIHCFEETYFIYDQTNRIAEKIINKYQTLPEFLWEDTPGCAVFRSANSQKWFGLIMNIDKSKLDNGTGEIEILNVKLPEEKISELIEQEGYYRCYHMNKKKWITIILDDTLSDEQIMEHIDESYQLISNPKEWLVPANPQYYDIIHCFDDTDTILWKQSSHIQIGDIVYMYVAKPYSAILYKCQAIEVNIPYQYQDKNLSMKYTMKIKLLEKYPQGLYTFDVLKQYGIRAVRGPRYMPQKLLQKINS